MITMKTKIEIAIVTPTIMLRRDVFLRAEARRRAVLPFHRVFRRDFASSLSQGFGQSMGGCGGWAACTLLLGEGDAAALGVVRTTGIFDRNAKWLLKFWRLIRTASA